MKRCPQCGATAGDDDVFCESDGVRLEAEARAAGAAEPTTTTLACAACGAKGTDDGEGWCNACGHRLAASDAPPIGARLGRYVIHRAHGDDDAIGKDETGADALVAVGEALEAEADALAKVKDARLPTVLARDKTHLALSMAHGRPLVEAAPALDGDGVTAMLRAGASVCRALDEAGLRWAPRATDAHVDAAGALSLARLRVSTDAGSAKEPFDVRPFLDAIAPALLSAPAKIATDLVRLLAPHPAGTTATIAALDDALSSIAREPAPTSAGPAVGAFTDRGVRHPVNEDAMGVAHDADAGKWSVLAVCDGVSSSASAEQASSIAARAVIASMSHFARSGDLAFEAATNALGESIRAAHVAVCASTTDIKGERLPGCTVVAAFVVGARVIVGWLGDSRAYWLTARGGELLTKDHSWVNETVERGEMTEVEALASPYAHAITKCIGPLEDPHAQVDPSIRVRDLAGPGFLVLCSDGMWNYAQRPNELAALVAAVAEPRTPATLARALVRTAVARGGHDNVTVAIYQHR